MIKNKIKNYHCALNRKIPLYMITDNNIF